MQEMLFQFLGWEDPLEKETAIHCSVTAWEMPWTEEPGALQSVGPQRVGHNWMTKYTGTKINNHYIKKKKNLLKNFSESVIQHMNVRNV